MGAVREISLSSASSSFRSLARKSERCLSNLKILIPSTVPGFSVHLSTEAHGSTLLRNAYRVTPTRGRWFGSRLGLPSLPFIRNQEIDD